jgi:hypothetical protein
MIPVQFDASTSSAAERKLFELLKNDPATKDWIVLHSLGLSKRLDDRGRTFPYGEIDFVVLIPGAGVFCLEVKGGRIACTGGTWETTNRAGQTEVLNRSPFLQAREGMFALRDSVLNRAPMGFPTGIIFGYAVIMPDISFKQRSPEWEAWQVIDRDALNQSISVPLFRLAAEQRKLHGKVPGNEPTASTLRTIQQLLRPDFEVIVTRGAQIEETEAQLLKLTEEQFDALDLLADNERCLFEGPAGTGKTMLALEYARRSAKAGKRTLFICFNRLLGEWLERQAVEPGGGGLTAGRFFKLLRDVIMRSSIAAEFREQEERGQATELYESAYPMFGRLAVEEQNQPYDVLVMDEAQDLLRPGVLEVLNAWLKGGLASGCWAIFGDFQRQAIFGSATGDEMKALLKQSAANFSKGRLTMNCRNTRNIGEETALLSGFDSPPYRMGQIPGLPVDYRHYDSTDAQRTALAGTLRRLLADHVKPADIIVTSRLRLENSGIAGVDGGDHFRLVEAGVFVPPRSRIPVIRFATAQAFKGMESPVIVLCDVEQVTDTEPQALLYVAMSRARSQLTVLLHEQTRPFVAECVRRKLQESWNKHP